jgi:hypothetical protein
MQITNCHGRTFQRNGRAASLLCPQTAYGLLLWTRRLCVTQVYIFGQFNTRTHGWLLLRRACRHTLSPESLRGGHQRCCQCRTIPDRWAAQDRARQWPVATRTVHQDSAKTKYSTDPLRKRWPWLMATLIHTRPLGCEPLHLASLHLTPRQHGGTSGSFLLRGAAGEGLGRKCGVRHTAIAHRTPKPLKDFSAFLFPFHSCFCQRRLLKKEVALGALLGGQKGEWAVNIHVGQVRAAGAALPAR